MRFFARILVAVIATAMLGLVSGVSSSPANAAHQERQFEARTFAAHPSVGDKAKQSRKITINFQGRGRVFNLVGQVGPKKKSKRIGIALYRSNTRNGRYTKFKGSRTNGNAKYGFYRLGRAGWYRTGTPGTKKFRASSSGKIHVVYR